MLLLLFYFAIYLTTIVCYFAVNSMKNNNLPENIAETLKGASLPGG